MDKLGVPFWSGSLESTDDSFLESTSTTAFWGSDDSFLESDSATVVTLGNAETYARDPALMDTASTMYRPLVHHALEEHEMDAFLDDLLDDDSSDDETNELSRGFDEGINVKALRAVGRLDIALFGDDSSDDDSDGRLDLSRGFGKSQVYVQALKPVKMVDLKRKRKRDEFDWAADYELLVRTWEWIFQHCGRAGSLAERPIASDGDAAPGNTNLPAGAADCIDLSDWDFDDDDCAVLACANMAPANIVPCESESDDEPSEPTAPEWSADDENWFGWSAVV